ncbi:MAG: 16S rRNA (guanine(527)-N(7))-methyltransferase RsmG [Oscillospiraceae bacterium]|jgi:16S rRNA (guanine527-N7)-methyltransferase|nr:16S rRNA (guanine(527)-N(7))-methyltransferase RsmG [Oscillospiraceae bacterium]
MAHRDELAGRPAAGTETAGTERSRRELTATAIRAAAADAGVALNRMAAEQLEHYALRLLRENEKYNLTAITAPEEVLYKHFLDSLLPLAKFPPPEGASLLDVGTGAGFPGLVIAIARPDLRVTLLDSAGKKVRFLAETACELGVPARTLQGRAEELARGELRGRFDLVTARAVAALPVLCEYCLPLVKPGGAFLALKGQQGREELAQAARAIALLGGETAEQTEIAEATLGENGCFGQRTLLLIRKISQTPTKYPRNGGLITKKPL